MRGRQIVSPGRTYLVLDLRDLASLASLVEGTSHLPVLCIVAPIYMAGAHCDVEWELAGASSPRLTAAM